MRVNNIARIWSLLLIRLNLSITRICASDRLYSNATLFNAAGDISVVVYLPFGVSVDGSTPEVNDLFYYSSRFDHGSMIGTITRRQITSKLNSHRNDPTDESSSSEEHVLYGTSLWRIPHNVRWPESGVGLASEFGVGDNGSFCSYRCGWNQASDITNGVLGYEQARIGQSFLKIGVGELKKGTCPDCDSTEDYMVRTERHIQNVAFSISVKF
jgi:hypothetical protein